MQRRTLFLTTIMVGIVAIAASAGYPASAQSPDGSQDGIVPLPADGARAEFVGGLGEKLIVVEELPGPVAWDPAQPVRDGAAAASTPEPAGSYSPSVVEDFAADVVRLVNEERARAGCDALAVDPTLSQVAYGHSKDMGDNDFFDHVSETTGLDPGQRITAGGYASETYAENIAGGQSSPQAAVTSWYNSETGHKENMLNCNYCETGVGYYYTPSSTWGHYWTQVFTRPLNRACRTPETPMPTDTPETPSPTVTPVTPTPTVTPQTPTPTVTPDARRNAYVPIVFADPQQAQVPTLVRNGDFELGPDGVWLEISTHFGGHPGALITSQFPDTFEPYSGIYAAWLGGQHNEDSDLFQSITLPYVHGLRLRFVYYVASQEEECDYDLASVYWVPPGVGARVPLLQIPLCGGEPYPNWEVADIPLEARGVPIGATGFVHFEVKTDESAYSNLVIDDVLIYLPATD